MEDRESSKEEGEDGKYGKNGEDGWGWQQGKQAGQETRGGGEGRYHLRGGVGGRQRGGGGGRVPHQLDTRRVDLHCMMMRQLTTLFAKMGNLGGRGCRAATATTCDNNNYDEEEEEEDDNGGEVVKGEGGGGGVKKTNLPLLPPSG
jgi:hypothetical protein